MDWGMIGHTWAVNLLAGHIAREQERHTYLITGPQGVGRRTLALRFSQGLNCKNPIAPGQPCRSCSTCKRIEAMQHPDLSLVQAEHEGEVLKIEQIRELQHSLALSPYEARYRIALILRAEEAHANAANAMLKTLEEPPAQVIVFLTANSSENLLPTIVSRCEVIRLRPLSSHETSEGLRLITGMPAETAELLAHISGGRPGYAMQLFNHPRLLEQRRSFIEDLLQLLDSSRRERFAFAFTHLNDREELRLELQIWLSFWRDALIYAAGLNDAITNLDFEEALRRIAGLLGMKVQFPVNAIERTIGQIEHNVNPRLALEVLLMDFPRLNVISSIA
jgi:DNA polymerase III subunit delta'